MTITEGKRYFVRLSGSQVATGRIIRAGQHGGFVFNADIGIGYSLIPDADVIAEDTVKHSFFKRLFLA